MKRFFDFSLALVVLIVLLPLWVAISMAVLLESKGGVFYKQIRVGMGNHDFYLYKFRTMHVGSDKKGLLTVGERDNRITRVGYFLRKYKLDEFPQLLNILKGDMSIVGPRPEVRRYVDMYTPEQLQVLNVRPGLTDPASIRYVNENEVLAAAENPEKTYIETVMPAKLALNLEYIREQSIMYDAKLIFKTFKAIL